CAPQIFPNNVRDAVVIAAKAPLGRRAGTGRLTRSICPPQERSNAFAAVDYDGKRAGPQRTFSALA
ncbi:MAG: hypothetical protein ACO3EK_03890, partial [Alphaproteobacteria bacterium]